MSGENLPRLIQKTKKGFTDNSVRISGTGDNNILEESLRKGINITNLTPSIYPNDNLLNGFNRHKQLIKIGYKEWIFALYEEDKENATEFQSSHEEFMDDFRAAANKSDGTKVITDLEIIELGRKRFENRKERSKDKIKKWIETLDLNLGGHKIGGIAKRISSDFERRGVIQSFNRKESEEFLTNLGIGADVLNTHGTEGDKTRVLRLQVVAMENYVANKSTLNVALFDSQASSHEDLDSHRESTLDMLKELDDLIMSYAAARISHRDIEPLKVIGALPQKIGDVTEVSNSLVKLEE